jgi:1-deoxy-D-xylulose-5-phosphate reductoisomerase
MRLPILYALTYPDRVASDMHFSLMDLRHLDFYPPDMEKFPCLRLAYEAAEAGGAKTVALNAADEVAVAAFLGGSVRFEQIPVIIDEVLSETGTHKLESIKKVLEADSEARKIAVEKVEQLGRGKNTRVTVGASQGQGE